MVIGQSLARYAIVDDAKEGKRYMVWTVHHVLYDGWSEPLILREVSNALRNQRIEPHAQMKDYVKYMWDTDEAAMKGYWRQELQGAVGPQFPKLPSRDFLPTPDVIIERQISLQTNAGLPFTLATLVRGAWALVASQYIGSDDVVFGETLTGRDIPLAEVESIVGPLIATIPVRIQINRSSSVEEYLQGVQESMLARTPYQHMGWQNIRKVSSDAQYACETGTGLIIQPEPEYVGSELGFDQGDVVREALHFNPYPLMIAFGIRKGGFRACASFDSSLIETTQMERMLAQLETVCSQLTGDLSKKIDDISCLSQAELDQIWRWNQTPPLSFDGSSRVLRADASINQGSTYPRAVVPWVCNSRNPSMLSPIGCVGELWLEGSCLPGETVTSLPWLLAGSSAFPGRTGKLQATGDLVELRADGDLIFVSRKENTLPVQGHAVDISELEAHVAGHLQPTIRAAVAISQPSPDSNQRRPELLVFIEQQSLDGASVEVMSMNHDVRFAGPDGRSFETTVCATIATSLAIALKKLDKFIRDSLPSYMIPSTYVVVDRLPSVSNQVDYTSLKQLVSNIPGDVLIRNREGLTEAWVKNSVQTNLTASEDVLRSSWAKVLGIPVEEIDVDDNFFRLGGDSVLAMKLAASLRGQGYGLTVADIFRHMRLSDAAKKMKVNSQPNEKVQPYKPFSTMGHPDINLFLAEIVRPQLADSQWSIRDICPVTDSQALDIKATLQAPRTSVQYTMLFLDKGIDREQLLRACRDLVKTHDILRTVFVEQKSAFYQVVIDNLDAPVSMEWANEDLEQHVNQVCKQHVESSFQLGSSFLKLFHVEGGNGQHCLVIGLSHAQYDGVSLPRLLRDLETLYTGGTVADFEPYPSYMARMLTPDVQSKAIKYWSDLLRDSSLSILAGPSSQPEEKAIFQTKPVDITQRPEEITTANLLTAAWALVLARRLQKRDVTFGSITSGRNIDSAYLENVVGPCYQFTPVRVPFQSGWTAIDLLQFVQKQSVESAPHDFLGFRKISNQCTQWPPEARLFDTILHHQDWEDFDTMPFAGGVCRVDILNPHGDAPHPLKVVSFVQSGKTHVGVVGSESCIIFVDAILDELVVSVQELALCRSDPVLLL
jgi:aryl carrier-like protein